MVKFTIMKHTDMKNMTRQALVIGLSASMLCGCIKSTVGPIDKDTTAPGPLTDVKWEPIPGGAIISYEYPKDGDLLYANASLTRKDGSVREFKASLYSNSLKIAGIGDTDTYSVKLTAVDRSENHSEPVYIDITPDTPPVMKTYESLDVMADFGGITISFKNESKEDLMFEVYTASKENESSIELVKTFYTGLETGIFSVRGYEDSPREFQIRIRDKYLNWSETWKGTFTPIYEKELDKSLFKEMRLPTDAETTAWGQKMEYIWDGEIKSDGQGQEGCHTGTDPGIKWFTFDLGVKAKLSRFSLWFLQDDKHYFGDASPRQYEIWGCPDTPAQDGSWDGWTRLIKMENKKPSGLPTGSLTEDDRIAARAGDNANFPTDVPAVRYIRIKCLKNWSGNSNIAFTEITFWGDDKVGQGTTGNNVK